MRGYTHITSGIALGCLLYRDPLSIGLVVFGAMAPDLDTPYSKISKTFGNRISDRGFIRHRGFLHSFTMALILYVSYFLLFRNNAILPFILGFCLHIILDSFTPAGTMPFYPFLKTKVRFAEGKVRTGSIVDKILGVAFFVLAIFITKIKYL